KADSNNLPPETIPAEVYRVKNTRIKTEETNFNSCDLSRKRFSKKTGSVMALFATSVYTRRRGATMRELRNAPVRSEEHTSELQSREKLVCRLLLEKKK